MYMHVCSHFNTYQLMCNMSVSPTVSKVKDLGVTFSNAMSYRSHIDIICSKAHRRFVQYFISSNLGVQNFNVIICNLRFITSLEYGNVIWSPHFQTDVKRIESGLKICSKRLLKIKCNIIDYSSVLLPLQIYNDVVLLHKIVHGL